MAVLHSYLLHVCRHCRWLHLYWLLVCCLHRQPAFACSPSLVPTAVLHSYALLVCHQYRRPAFACVAEPHWCPLQFYIRTCCASATITAGYIHIRCSYAVNIINLYSHAFQSLAGAHCCSTFVHAAHLVPLLLATFVRAARLPSTLSTCVCTCCRASLLPTVILHSYALLLCRHHCSPAFVCSRTSLVSAAILRSYALLIGCQHRRPAFACIAEPRWYPLQSYIRTSSAKKWKVEVYCFFYR